MKQNLKILSCMMVLLLTRLRKKVSELRLFREKSRNKGEFYESKNIHINFIIAY